MKTTLSLTFGIIAALVLGVINFTKPAETPVVQPNLGSVSGPDFYGPYFAVNGVASFYDRKALTSATTTPCAFRSPAATSTLAMAALQITTGTSTATVWTVGNATTGFATTTPLSTFSLGSGAQGSMVVGIASTTINGPGIISPNTYIVWGVQGTKIADATKLLGTCSVEFRVI